MGKREPPTIQREVQAGNHGVQRKRALAGSTQDAVLDLSGRDLSPFEFGARRCTSP